MCNPIGMFGFGKKSGWLVFIALVTELGILYGQITTTTIYSNKVTYVSSNTPTTPMGGASNTFFVGREGLFVIGGPSNNFNYRSLLQFNLDDIDPNAIITSATLTLTRSGGVNPMEIIFARAETSWVESTATWNNQPTYQTNDEISITAPNTSVLTVDMKSHIQNMVSRVYPNNGWVLRGSVETGTRAVNRHYYSDHYSVAASRPKLEISYYIPMSVTDAVITHESASGANDGSISPVLANGPGGTYTYQWYNKNGMMPGKTALNLSGVPYGWYGLRVTSSIAGTEPFYYAFLVGENCAVREIEFNPGPDFIDDAVLQGPSLSIQSFQNYGSDGYESALDQVFFFTPIEYRTPIRFRLWIDGQLNVSQATLVLKVASNESDRSNASWLKRITEDWHESIVTHSSMPATSNDIVVNIPDLLLPPSEEKSINTIDFWQYWKQNNQQNFGFLFELEVYNGILAMQRYFSSDAAAANRPKVNFKVSVYDPVAPHYCGQIFAKMDRTLRGVRYKPHSGYLYFYYDEEYDTPDQGLNYNVYSDNDPITAVLDQNIQPLTEIEYGDNRYTLDTSMLEEGAYVLEVTNNKREKFYLRFKVEE